MHTNFLSATVLSLLAVSVSAAPTAVVSTAQSNIQQAHLPGSPHGSSLHPSLPKEVTQSSSTSPQDLDTRSLNVDEMKELIVEIKRSDDDTMNNSQDQDTKEGKDEEENHATYMLGSPISFPARGGQGGRSVA
jgi:ABC-type oligopeptide transport system substrate-binding subunit